MEKPIPEDFAALVSQLDELKADIAFARALRRLTFVTTSGVIVLQYNPESDNCVVDLRSLSASGTPPAAQIPSQTGHAGDVLTTDGATLAWT